MEGVTKEQAIQNFKDDTKKEGCIFFSQDEISEEVLEILQLTETKRPKIQKVFKEVIGTTLKKDGVDLVGGDLIVKAKFHKRMKTTVNGKAGELMKDGFAVFYKGREVIFVSNHNWRQKQAERWYCTRGFGQQYYAMYHALKFILSEKK